MCAQGGVCAPTVRARVVPMGDTVRARVVPAGDVARAHMPVGDTVRARVVPWVTRRVPVCGS